MYFLSKRLPGGITIRETLSRGGDGARFGDGRGLNSDKTKPATYNEQMVTPSKQAISELWGMHAVNLAICGVLSCFLLLVSRFDAHPSSFLVLPLGMAFGALNSLERGLEVGRKRLPWIVLKGILLVALPVVGHRQFGPTWTILFLVSFLAITFHELRRLNKASPLRL